MKKINDKTIKLLEFDKIRQNVAYFASNEMSRAEILAEFPSFNKIEIEHSLKLTAEAEKMITIYLTEPYCAIDCIIQILDKARVGAMLSMGELLKIAHTIKVARTVKNAIISTPDDIIELKKIVSGLVVDHPLENSITECIVNENEMSDRASEKLYGLRKRIQTLNFKLKEKLLSYTKNNNFSKYLQDNLVTIREGRYVLPVKSECRSEVKGLVHDKSATGSTVFVEPFAIVELNNELREAIIDEQAEIERILLDLTKRVEMSLNSLFVCYNTCIIIDKVICKAKYSIKIKGVLPEFNNQKTVFISQSRHPLIDNDKVIPVDVKVGGDYSILLISGPNTGGKTVCLKTVGLFCLMAYYGLLLPCKSASIYLFDEIFCDIGDEQSIENELSTFSSHINSLIYITENMSENSLVLLDEVGGGTDPDEGAAIARGIVKHILNVGSTAILTTHYGQLKEYALSINKIENACMEFNEETLVPTFKLIIGMPGSSNAIKIAKRLGLNENIINFATQSLSKDKVQFEKIIESAESIRRIASEELIKTQKIKDELIIQKNILDSKSRQLDETMSKIRQNAQVETKRLVNNSLARANDIIDEMRELMHQADEASILQAKKLRSELEDLSYEFTSEKFAIDCESVDPNEIIVGNSVIVKTLGSVGVIKSINHQQKTAEIQVGAIRTKVKFSDLGYYNPPKKDVKNPTKKCILPERVSSGFSEKEIKVIGLTVSEAIEIIEPHIISMANDCDAKTLRIIHGKGTGALGKGIQAFLKKNPLVIEYRYGRYGEGDNGVTFATIK